MGEVVVMGPSGPTTPFSTSRGIRQGCPASPLLFAIFISFVERRLLRRCPHAGITMGSHRLLTVSYADDITVLCNTQEEALCVFKELQHTLAQLGLTTEASKCKLLHVSAANRSSCPRLQLFSSTSEDGTLPSMPFTKV